MTEDLRLESLIRSALPPASATMPSRDLWPSVADRIAAPVVRWSWFDTGLAVGVTIALFLFPQTLLPLAFHL
jgi:hypothetical protein